MTAVVEEKKKVQIRGRFLPGNPGGPGRPKGSKNQVTLLKLMAEEAVRDENLDKMLAVCRLVIEQAMSGDPASQKLVWDAVLSKGVNDSKQAQEKVQIIIGEVKQDSPVTIDGSVLDHETIEENTNE